MRGFFWVGMICASFALMGAPGRGQTPQGASLADKIAAVEAAMEAKRKEMGVPGLSLVIVQDDRVILSKGFGLRDVAAKKPVTPETLFAIGSSTKAFTALAAVMLQDEGKLSLKDSPKKYLPYFKLQDPDADAKITLRDTLCHNSGLGRTDLLWVGNKLTREEAIRALAFVKPTAKLGEKWQYQNLMYSVAGDATASAAGTTWEKLISDRILRPLGMTETVLTVAEMTKAADFAQGYTAGKDGKAPVSLPARDVPSAAPAGAVNSTATDMAKWLRLMLGGGVYEGKRLVSEGGYKALTSPQMKISPVDNYGLGWVLYQWNGERAIEHGGNVDGYTAHVAFAPDKKVGFVLLCNANASPIGVAAREIIWKQFVAAPAASLPIAPAVPADAVQNREAGKKNVAEGVGEYFVKDGSTTPVMEIAERDGNISLIAPNQPPYPLEAKTKDALTSPALPNGFSGKLLRDAAGNVTGMNWKQPGVDVNLIRKSPAKDAKGSVTSAAPKYAAPISADELIRRQIAAMGGEKILRGHVSQIVKGKITMDEQGLHGEMSGWNRAPNAAAQSLVLRAGGGKAVLSSYEYFDGAKGGQWTDISPESPLEGGARETARRAAILHPELQTRKLYKDITITGEAKEGGEDCYVVEYKPEKGEPVKAWISKKTFLPVRRDTVALLPGVGALPQSLFVSDYRMVDGEKVPFRITQKNPLEGEAVITVESVKFNERIPDATFQSPAKRK